MSRHRANITRRRHHWSNPLRGLSDLQAALGLTLAIWIPVWLIVGLSMALR